MKRFAGSSLARFLGAFALAASAASASAQLSEITVAYFQEWPTANQVAQLEKTYDQRMGVKVNWRFFANGNEMAAAMASGQVQISYSQGLVPFTLAVTRGVPLKMIGVAVAYAEADNCVVSKASGITRETVKKLEGMKVGTPIGNVTHYKLLRMLAHLGVDANKVNMVQMTGADAAVAFARGDIAMGCAFGGPMLRMKEQGEFLMTAAEQQAIGIRVFDVISVTEDFMTKHPQLVQTFMDVTNEANLAYARNPGEALPKIARASGMKNEDAKRIIDMFAFPTKEQQTSPVWLGGSVQKFMKEVAEFFATRKQIDKALPSYDHSVTTQFLK